MSNLNNNLPYQQQSYQQQNYPYMQQPGNFNQQQPALAMNANGAQ